MIFETIEYVVCSIDGDYAHLKKEGQIDGDLKLVARALHPAYLL